jgi:hypothetical protein
MDTEVTYKGGLSAVFACVFGTTPRSNIRAPCAERACVHGWITVVSTLAGGVNGHTGQFVDGTGSLLFHFSMCISRTNGVGFSSTT